jgi:hypothetical protein
MGDEVSLSDAVPILSLRKLNSKPKKILFEFLQKAYKLKGKEFNPNKYAITFFCLLAFLQTLELLSFLISLEVKIFDWLNFRTLWRVILYSRIDFICASIDQTANCLIVGFSFYFFLLVATFFALLCYRCAPSRAKKLIFLLKQLLLVKKIIDIPFMSLFCLTLKYSWQHGLANEYEHSISLDYGWYGIVFSLLCLLIIALYQYLDSVFNYDTRHAIARFSPQSRANGNASLWKCAVIGLTVLMYCFLSQISLVIYWLIAAIIHTSMLMVFWLHLPYYSFIFNAIVSLKYLVVSVFSLVLLVGYAENSAGFCALGLIILCPVCAVIWFWALIYRKQRIRVKTLARTP